MRITLGLHNHTCMSDGELVVSDLLKLLKKEYDVIAITDHNVITAPHPMLLKEAEVEDLIIIGGVEISLPQMHIICLEPRIHDMGLRKLIATSEVRWLAHPIQSRIVPDVARMIVEREELHGVEQYNSGEISFKGELDGFLFAGDDLHIKGQLKSSWMEMDVDSKDKDTILEKLKSGEFEIYNDPSRVPSWW